MQNPWESLPTSKPYLLDSDKEAILNFNKSANENHFIHYELLPEPFIGDPNAPIILLNLNPGYSEKDIKFHNDPYYIQISRNRLEHKASDYPFYALDPKISESPMYDWWVKKLKPLIDKAGAETVANKICCIELFPYHSKKYKQLKGNIRSQEYGFHLVRKAIERNALIVIMRAKKRWLKEVPELKDYCEVKNYLNPVLSRRNLGEEFDKIIEKLPI